MNDKLINQLARALEIIANAKRPRSSYPGGAPSHHYYEIKAIATAALTDPKSLPTKLQHMESMGWELPLPLFSEVEQVRKHYQNILDVE